MSATVEDAEQRPTLVVPREKLLCLGPGDRVVGRREGGDTGAARALLTVVGEGKANIQLGLDAGIPVVAGVALLVRVAVRDLVQLEVNAPVVAVAGLDRGVLGPDERTEGRGDIPPRPCFAGALAGRLAKVARDEPVVLDAASRCCSLDGDRPRVTAASCLALAAPP